MKIVNFGLFGSIVGSIILLAASFVEIGLEWFGNVICIFGILWIMALSFRLWWSSYSGLLVIFLTAAIGLWMNLDFRLMLAVGFLGLIAFDLSDFSKRLSFKNDEDDISILVRAHMIRLIKLIFICIALVVISSIFTIKLIFEWSLILIIIVILGAGKLVKMINSKT